MTRQREWQLRMLAKRLCINCGKRKLAVKSISRCRKCLTTVAVLKAARLRKKREQPMEAKG